MDAQKIKNKKVIGLIYGILTVLLGVGAVTLILSALFFFLTLFSPSFEPFFPVVEIPLEISDIFPASHYVMARLGMTTRDFPHVNIALFS